MKRIDEVVAPISDQAMSANLPAGSTPLHLAPHKNGIYLSFLVDTDRIVVTRKIIMLMPGQPILVNLEDFEFFGAVAATFADATGVAIAMTVHVFVEKEKTGRILSASGNAACDPKTLI